MPVTNALNLSDPNNRFDPDNFNTVKQALISDLASVVNIVNGSITTGSQDVLVLQENDDRKSVIIQNTSAYDMKIRFTTQQGQTKNLTIPAYSSLTFEAITMGSVHMLSQDHSSVIEQYVQKCEITSQVTLGNDSAGTVTYEVYELS